ncbi:MAG: rhombosortase [Thiolinea sp.]
MPRPYLIFASLVSLLLVLLQMAKPLLLYRRDLILEGEWWRILSGNLVHTNLPHLLMNMAGFWLLLLLCHPVLGIRLLTGSLFLLGSLIGLLLLALQPALHWYAGLSGILYGLFVTGGLLLLRHDRLTGAALLILTAGKTLLDLWQGDHGISQNLINAPVAVAAHWFGMLGGLGIAAAVHPTRRHDAT